MYGGERLICRDLRPCEALTPMEGTQEQFQTVHKCARDLVNARKE